MSTSCSNNGFPLATVNKGVKCCILDTDREGEEIGREGLEERGGREVKRRKNSLELKEGTPWNELLHTFCLNEVGNIDYYFRVLLIHDELK